MLVESGGADKVSHGSKLCVAIGGDAGDAVGGEGVVGRLSGKSGCRLCRGGGGGGRDGEEGGDVVLGNDAERVRVEFHSRGVLDLCEVDKLCRVVLVVHGKVDDGRDVALEDLGGSAVPHSLCILDVEDGGIDV